MDRWPESDDGVRDEVCVEFDSFVDQFGTTEPLDGEVWNAFT